MRAWLRGLFVCGSVALVAACSAADGHHGFESNGTGDGNGDGTPAADGGSSNNGGHDSGTTPPGSNDAGAPGAHDASGPPPGNDAGSPPMDAGGPPPPVDASDGFDQFQHHNLDVINMYRATLGVAPLVLDKQLCDFALAGSQELSQDHMPHQHFINASNDGTLWTSGFNMSAAENQGDPNGWYKLANDPVQNELLQIDAIQKAMFDEGPGAGEPHGHYMNMMNPDYKTVGVGLVMVGTALYLTNDFSE